jgi:Tfp pilus assembly protein PilN
MIKINLLLAMNDNAEGDAGADTSGNPIKAFLARFLPSKPAQAPGEAASDVELPNPGLIVAKILVMVAVAGGFLYYEAINIPRLEKELAEHSEHLQQLSEYNNKAAQSVAEIQKLEEQKAQIDKQIESLDGLSRVRLRYIRALDLIQTNLPEKMWFLTLKSKERLIEATGVSLTEAEITEYIDVMGRSVHFSDVSMISSEDVPSKEQGKSFKKFLMNFLMEGGIK